VPDRRRRSERMCIKWNRRIFVYITICRHFKTDHQVRGYIHTPSYQCSSA
jgi:hypothetical protein